MQQNFAKDVSKLEKGILPENWEWTGCNTQARMAHFNGHPESYFKEFIPKSTLEVFKSKFRGTRCQIWAQQAEVARDLGFDVPEVLDTGVLNNKNHYLITSAGPTDSTQDYLKKTGQHDEANRQRWIKNFGAFVGRMHKAGIVHGDMRPGNILMEPTTEGRFVMIDIERNSLHKLVPMGLVKKNLVQLAKKLTFKEFTAKDRVNFFRSYNEAYGRFDKKQQKRLAYDVIALVKKQNYWGGQRNVSSVSEII